MRRCKICGKPLANANRKNKCFRHGIRKDEIDEPFLYTVCTSRKDFGVIIDMEYNGVWGRKDKI